MFFQIKQRVLARLRRGLVWRVSGETHDELLLASILIAERMHSVSGEVAAGWSVFLDGGDVSGGDLSWLLSGMCAVKHA